MFCPSGLKRQIENVKQKIQDLKAEISALESKRTNAADEAERSGHEQKIKEKLDEVAKLEALSAEWEAKLAAEKKMIEERMYTGEQCIAARVAVEVAFEQATRDARSETDPEIVPLAKRLIADWEKEVPGHAKAIADAKTAHKDCAAMR